MKIVALVLAAGNSSRLGQPKQLLVYQGKTLLKKAIEAAKNSVCDEVFVVTGAYAEKMSNEISPNCTEIFHAHWEDGMGTSVAFGLKEILRTKPHPDGVLILLCDQPFVDANLVNALIRQKSESKKGIVASAYSGTLGAPVLYDAKYFPELLTLSGHEGAKKILQKFSEDVASVDFPLGKVDVDTMGDYERLKSFED